MRQHSALSTHHSALFFVAIMSLVITTAGCPALPTLVRGQTGEDAPGELIEWPALQVDPTGEDTAGFNQVISADMNGDGLVDLITAAYESQPIQVHLQQRAADGTISFQSFSVAGSGPIVRVSELRVADMDQDGNLDIIMSILDNGLTPADECASQQGSIIILFAPPDPSDSLDWVEFNLTRNFHCELIDQIDLNGFVFDQEARVSSIPGFDGNVRNYASMDVADVNADGFPDILAAFNGCDDETNATKQVELWINPADDRIRQNEFEEIDPDTGLPLPPTRQDTNFDGKDDSCTATVISPWQKLLLQTGFTNISSARFSDVDLDGNLDVVALRPTSKTFDITWQVIVPRLNCDSNPPINCELSDPPDPCINPCVNACIDPCTDPCVASCIDPCIDSCAKALSRHPIGESDAGLDILEIGDLDGDGFSDVLALGQSDRLLRWFRQPLDPAAQFFPWDVFNIVQYSNLVPTALAIADLDGNGQLDIVAAAGGHIRWFTPLGDSPFESWSEQFVVSDALLGDASDTVGTSPFFPINSVHAVDIDGDGRLDVVATFDRQGTDNDLIVWFQNTEVEIE
ncbi:MAG: VCBS repeat-containing protein [Planctomycetes bacterium]|nr:VCBS repeat-containing protein [Planctomycetota bacterium]